MLTSGSPMVANFLMASLFSVLFAGLIYFASYKLSRKFRSLEAWPLYWLSGIVCAILPFIFAITPAEYQPLNGLPLAHSGLAPGDALAIASSSTTAEVSTFDLIRAQLNHALTAVAPIWLLIYCLGASIKIALLGYRHLCVRAIISRAKAPNSADAQRINRLLLNFTAKAVKRYRQRQPIKILTTNAVHSPFVVGFPKPILIVSETALKKLNDVELALVLEHELIHLSKRDPALLILSAWLSGLLWFNPFAHWCANRLKLAVELSCDTSILATKPDQKDHYLNAILSIINARNNTALTLNTPAFGGTPVMLLKTRLHHMKTPTRVNHHSVVKKLLLLLGLFVFVAANSALQSLAFARSNPRPETLINQLQTEKPIPTGRVSSKFGPRPDPFTKEERLHRGIDYAAPQGTPIVATADGEVIFAEEKGDYGLRIDINHGNNIATLYANLGELLVKPGQRVKRGDTIATAGVSGRSTGPHVHYEVHHNGKAICPSEHCMAE